MKNPININQLIKDCCNNNRQSQKLLVDKYSALIYAVAIRYMGDREKAKDIVQMSLLKILKNIKQFDSKKAKFETWITTITVNTCLSQLKKINLEILTSNYNTVVDLPVTEDVIDKMSTAELLDIIKALPDGFRQVFNLSVIDGFSHKEIADKIGIKESSSRSRLTRAKQMLRDQLSNLKQYEPWLKMR